MARIFHRNLFSHDHITPTPKNDTNYPCTNFCDPTCGNFEDCYTFPQSIDLLPPLPPPLPPVSIIVSPDTVTTQGVHISPLVILLVIVLASVFLLISYYAIVIKYCTFWNRIIIRQDHGEPPRSGSDTNQGGNHTTDALNQQHEDRDPVIDHPIWLISTIGLHQSVINAITMLRYKKKDGLIDGSDCSVCLSEFQEDETLRLLPKCKHAFHIDCIDTWLRSHTNCPLCRAGIVANPGRPSLASNEPGLGQSWQAELNPIFDSDSSGVELGRSPTRNRSEVVANMDASNVNSNDQSKDEVECKTFLRRSFSMDFFRDPNLQRLNLNSSSNQVMDSPSSSRPRPLGPPPMKRSYSWSERVFWSSRNLNNGNRDISP